MFINKESWYATYYWYVFIIFNLFNLSYNFKEKKTRVEMDFIMFAFIYRVFVIFYYSIGKLSGNMQWLNENMFFFSSIALSGIIGMIIRQHQLWKRKIV